MIRRHLTPAVVFFCCLLPCIFWPAPSGLPTGRFGAFGPAARAGIAAVALAAAAIALGASVSPGARRAGLLLLAAGLGIATGALSLARMRTTELRAYLPSGEEGVTSFTGRLRADSSLSLSGDTVLRVTLLTASSKMRATTATARGEALLLCAGDYRFAMGELIEVRSDLRSFDSTGPESFVAWVNREDIHGRGFASRAWRFRARTREWMHRELSLVGYPASALLEALITGGREDVPAELSEGFRRTGTLHVLALSGLHVGILYGLALAVFGFLPGRAGKIAAASAILIVYQLLAGFMPSLLRATIMLLAGSAASLLDRDSEPLNILAFSGIAVLAIDPFQAFSLSFQLSYLALAGILALAPLIRRPLEGRVPAILLGPLSVSIGAQLVTLPVVLPSFGVWYPSGILASMILVPLITVFLSLGLGWLVLSPLLLSPLLRGPLLAAATRVFDALYGLIDGSASLLARLPGVTVGPPAVAWAALAAAAAAIALGLLLPRRVPRLAR
ncbi:MAG: ComEC/Rec2 family competence protein [Spirochaetes bacterium]|nr:ComEC/Rec2 family competence protein [Spirochaetota bacterium]